jgi:acyl carrier protein/ribosomal protein S18 acetylase RimI-like enzyme
VSRALAGGLEIELKELLRESALAGSAREIPTGAPLGGDELGIDSLGFVTFLTAAEGRFGVAIPEELWLERGHLTLHDLAEYLRDAARPAAAPPPRAPAPSLARRLARRLLACERCHVLTFDLRVQPMPVLRPPRGIAFRDARPRDLALTEGLWPAHVAARNAPQFLARLDAGYACRVALADGAIVAMTWSTTREDEETMTGLLVRPSPGACYALDLNVHPAYGGRAIGEALLAFELREAGRAGLLAEHTIVRADNLGMLASAGGVGFRRTGGIETRRILGRPFSRWRRGERAGSGVLPL